MPRCRWPASLPGVAARCPWPASLPAVPGRRRWKPGGAQEARVIARGGERPGGVMPSECGVELAFARAAADAEGAAEGLAEVGGVGVDEVREAEAAGFGAALGGG